MSKVEIKTVILFNKRRLRPQTIEAILAADDGTLIGVDPDELSSFLPLNIWTQSFKKEFKPELDTMKQRRALEAEEAEKHE